MDKEAIFQSSGIYHSNSVVILTSCDSELSHRLYRVMFMSDLILETGKVPQTHHKARKTIPIHQPTK